MWLHDRYVENDDYAGIIVSLSLLIVILYANVWCYKITRKATCSFDCSRYRSRLPHLGLTLMLRGKNFKD